MHAAKGAVYALYNTAFGLSWRWANFSKTDVKKTLLIIMDYPSELYSNL